MLDIDTLINYWGERTWDQPPPSELRADDVILATIAYLNAYKQARLMLIDLGKGGSVSGLEAGMQSGLRLANLASHNPGSRMAQAIERAQNLEPGGDNKGKRGRR